MTLRRAIATDAEAIADIWNAIVRDPAITFTSKQKTSDDVRQMIEAQPVFVVDSDDELAGFATYGDFRSGPGYRHTAEVTIHLAPRMRGGGIGRLLLSAILDHARGQGVHVMVAGVSGQNDAAIGFHLAMGFKEVGRMPEVGRKAGEWLDLVLLQKLLNT